MAADVEVVVGLYSKSCRSSNVAVIMAGNAYRCQCKHQLMFSFAVLNFTFEADAKKRKRVNFLGLHQTSLKLPEQKKEICSDITLQLLVQSCCPVKRRIKRSRI